MNVEVSVTWAPELIAPTAPQVPAVVAALGGLAPAEFRERVQAIEASMREYPQLDCEPVHRFAPGLYARELSLPAGSLVVGKIHRHAHLIQLLHGTATIATEHGLETITAPAMWTSKVGAKRVVYSHTDTVFVTFHPSDETDLVKLEESIIAPSYEALEHIV